MGAILLFATFTINLPPICKYAQNMRFGVLGLHYDTFVFEQSSRINSLNG